MTTCDKHTHHNHQHGPNCGHTAIKHNGHVDYLHDGHLHHQQGSVIEEHRIEVTNTNPDTCTQGRSCTGHDTDHVHGPGCGHEAIPHGDHTCYIVNGRLHHPHNGHCDDHGPIEIIH